MNLSGNEREILKTNHTIDEAAAKRLRIKVHPPGTVIFPKIGGAIATNKRRVLVRPTAIDNNCSGIIPNESCSTHWLFLVLSAIDFAEYQSGTSVPAVNQGALGEIEVSLPPLAEQKRIVAKVDELMALCDRLEAQQQERETRHAALARASLARFADAPTPANLNFLFHPSFSIQPSDLRKSILTLAVQGKLVPQDPNDEPVEVLVKKIFAEQERLVKARQIRRLETAPLAEDNEPFAIPSTWTWTRLGRIGDWGSGSTPPRGSHELYGGSVPWLKSGELNDNRALAGSEETVTELAVKTCSFRLNEPGDILLAMYGATIGKAAILAEAAVTNQAVCGCTPFPGVLNTYLFDYLLSQRDAFRTASEGGAQPNISKAKIVGYPFPLPPLAEQRRIVAKVELLMALVDELETQLAASRATGANLLSALVSELTAQV
jgi:type I restriction enzyme S subunit